MVKSPAVKIPFKTAVKFPVVKIPPKTAVKIPLVKNPIAKNVYGQKFRDQIFYAQISSNQILSLFSLFFLRVHNFITTARQFGIRICLYVILSV